MLKKKSIPHVRTCHRDMLAVIRGYALRRAHKIENSKLFRDFDHRHRSAFWIKAELGYRHCHQIDKIRNKLM